jgi:hypothetical protein
MPNPMPHANMTTPNKMLQALLPTMKVSSDGGRRRERASPLPVWLNQF